MSFKRFGAIVLALIALVVVIGAVFAGGCITINEPSSVPASTPAPAVAPAPAPASAPAPAVVTTIPMDFEVSSTTTATGHYQVMAYGDIILFCPNIEMWNSIYPGNWYHADVTANGDGTYNIVDITLTSYGYNGNVVYYYDGSQYYADFGGYAHPIVYSEVRGKVNYRAPTHPVYRGATSYTHPREGEFLIPHR